MHRTIIMKRISFVVFLIFSLTISPLWAEESSQTAYPLGVYEFDLARLGADEASQISALQSIGYSGLILNVNNEKQLEKLKRYQAAIGDDPFKVYAGLFTAHFHRDLAAQNAHLDKAIQSLKQANAPLWLILRGKANEVKRAQVVEFLRSAAERTKAAGVELVIYPHSGDIVQSAEEALPYLEEVQNGNVFLSLHLWHELKAGNGDRLDEVAAKIGPWLRLSSINGAYVVSGNEVEIWKRGIKPLTMGDYDSSKLLRALKSVHYKGPVLLLTYGLQRYAKDHHQTSFKRFQEMVDALDED